MLGGLIYYFLPTSMGFLEQSKSTKIMYLIIYLENLGCVFPMNKNARLLEFCRGSYHVFPICCPREKNVGDLKIYFWTNFRGNSRTRQKSKKPCILYPWNDLNKWMCSFQWKITSLLEFYWGRYYVFLRCFQCTDKCIVVWNYVLWYSNMFNGMKIYYVVWKYVIWSENMYRFIRSITSYSCSCRPIT